MLKLSSRREDKHVCFLQVDLIHTVEMRWLQVEPTVASSVNQSSDFLSSTLWANTGRHKASYANVNGKYKGLNFSVYLTPTLQDLITCRLDTDSVRIHYLICFCDGGVVTEESYWPRNGSNSHAKKKTKGKPNILTPTYYMWLEAGL